MEISADYPRVWFTPCKSQITEERLTPCKAQEITEEWFTPCRSPEIIHSRVWLTPCQSQEISGEFDLYHALSGDYTRAWLTPCKSQEITEEFDLHHAKFSGDYRRVWLTSCKSHEITEEFEFVLFSDTWSQQGHSVSCMTIRFPKVVNHQSRHQATSKMGVRLVISGNHCNLPYGFVWVCMG